MEGAVAVGPQQLSPPPTTAVRVRSRSASLPAQVHQTALLQFASTHAHVNGGGGDGDEDAAIDTTVLASLAAPAPRADADVMERLRQRRHYYRRLVEAGHATYAVDKYLPGERVLVGQRASKCIGLALSRSDICVVSGSLVLTNFRVIFAPSSSHGFLKARSLIPLLVWRSFCSILIS